MRKRHLYLIRLALVLALTGLAAAQDWDIEIPSTKTPPIIDGKVDGVWSIASIQYITVTIDGSVDSPEDSSGSWRVMWDGTNLYAIVDINDSALYNDSSNSYLDDSVEFYFDGGNSKGPGAPLSDNDRQYTFGWTTDDIQGTNTDTTGVEHAQVRTETGWRIEMQFPWMSLQGAAPQLGDLIGVDCFYNDDDNGGDSRESQIATFADDNGDWQVPSDWGTAILVKGSREKAAGPNPDDGATNVLRDAILSWTAGEFAVTHDVYFGTAFDDVNTASRADPMDVLVSQGQPTTSYVPSALLEYGQTYYWRIDEVNGAPDNTIFQGEVWSFTTEPLAAPITDIVATSNIAPEPDSGPENTINGSGLNEAGGHSINAGDMWLIAPGGETPWILYGFNRVYKLQQMLVWNYNVQFEKVLGFGLKDVIVEYSADGVDWVSLEPIQFAQATARANYAANTTVDFGGVPAKYVRLTATSAWGVMGQYGLSEVEFLAIPVHAALPEPADAADETDIHLSLAWRPGREAVSHEVYFAADEQAVADGTAAVAVTGDSSYDPGVLDYGRMYYWRVDEVNEAEALSLWEGDVWRFMTREFGVVDDFESYDDDTNRIYDTWLDGWANETGSTVGYMEAPFAEQQIVEGGIQSMPLAYDNSAAPFYSEAQYDLGPADWTMGRPDRLRLYFRGYPVAFVQRTDGTVVVGGQGTDIWGTSDQFRYVYKQLSGDGSIVVRVDRIANSNEWAKAGVMIRESLTAPSKHVSVVVTPESGISLQRRVTAGSDSADTTEAGLVAPYWVKLTRTGNTFTAQRSADGTTWVPITATAADSTLQVSMPTSVYIGLAVTSHDAAVPTTAEFSNLATMGSVSGQWTALAIGAEQPSNAPDSLYVAIEDGAGHVATVMHPDAEATNVMDWQSWEIPLSEFIAVGVNLANVRTMYIGIGDRNGPQAGGAGTVYVDSIGIGRPAAIVPDVTNLLANGGFEDGVMAPWSIYGDVTTDVVTTDPIEGHYCLLVSVGSAGANFWDAGLQHTGHLFEAGKKYTLSAFLKCSEGTREINFKPELAADPWTGYGDQIFTMTDEWAEFSVTTPVLEVDVDPAAITFHIAFAAGDFWIDDVRFYEGDYVSGN